MIRVLSRMRGSSDLAGAVALALAAVLLLSGAFPTVRFTRERIHIRVEESRLRVMGVYEYFNPSAWPATVTLGVPVPRDDNHLPPVVLQIEEVDAAGRFVTDIASATGTGEARFRLFFRPEERRWIRVFYLQPVRASRGRYLLTTTRKWRRPIEEASFTLALPEAFRLASSNYELSPQEKNGSGFYVAGFSRQEFFPDGDWEFAWVADNAVGTGVRP